MITILRPTIDPEHLAGLGAAELLTAMGSGESRVSDVVAAHIERIERVDASLNAVVVRRFAEARAEALAMDTEIAQGGESRELAGLPITVKDQFLLAGTPTTFGLAWRGDHRAAEDGPLVAALRAAGAIVLGKTNVSQTTLFAEADNPLYGRTSNPWDLARSPGGSSGGEAAIIAAGGSALGLGGDIGGSVRVPAAFTGIAALKPTSLRLTLADTPADIFDWPPAAMFLYQPGPMARDVADLHLAMRVLVAASEGAPEVLAGEPYPSRLPGAGGMRIAVHLDDSVFRCSPAVRRAVNEATEHLVAAGASLSAFDPPPLREAPRLFLGLLAAQGGRWIRAGMHGERPMPQIGGLLTVVSIPNAVRPLAVGALRVARQRHLAATIAMCRSSGDASLARLEGEVTAYRAAYADAMDRAGVDVVLSPPFALPAVRHGATRVLHTGNAQAFAALYNLLGLPAGVVPVTTVRSGEESDRPASRDLVEIAAMETERGSQGLPVAVQVAGRPWAEAAVLAAMAAIEAGARSRSGRLTPPEPH